MESEGVLKLPPVQWGCEGQKVLLCLPEGWWKEKLGTGCLFCW